MFNWMLLTVALCGGVRLARAAEQDPNACLQGSGQAQTAQDVNRTLDQNSAPNTAAAAPAAGAVVDANANTAPAAPAAGAVSDANANTAPGDANSVAPDADPSPAPEAVEPGPSQMSQMSQKKTLVISSNPVEAQVSIDGVEVGLTPLTVDRASLGDANSVTVRWTRYDCDAHEMQVLLDPNNPEIDVGAYLYRRKQHALGVQYTGYFAANIAHGAALFYRHYFPYHLFATAGLGVTTVMGSSGKAMPLVLLGVGYDSGSSHDDPLLPGLDRSNLAFTPSLEGELVGPSNLAGLYLYPVSVRAYYAFASFGIGYQFNHTALYSGFGCRLNVGAQWTFF